MAYGFELTNSLGTDLMLSDNAFFYVIHNGSTMASPYTSTIVKNSAGGNVVYRTFGNLGNDPVLASYWNVLNPTPYTQNKPTELLVFVSAQYGFSYGSPTIVRDMSGNFHIAGIAGNDAYITTNGNYTIDWAICVKSNAFSGTPTEYGISIYGAGGETIYTSSDSYKRMIITNMLPFNISQSLNNQWTSVNFNLGDYHPYGYRPFFLGAGTKIFLGSSTTLAGARVVMMLGGAANAYFTQPNANSFNCFMKNTLNNQLVANDNRSFLSDTKTSQVHYVPIAIMT